MKVLKEIICLVTMVVIIPVGALFGGEAAASIIDGVVNKIG